MMGDPTESKTHVIYTVASCMMGLAVTAIAVRFWTRLRSKTYLWWDDWLALAALVNRCRDCPRFLPATDIT